jgi:tape measure domain-containing protein
MIQEEIARLTGTLKLNVDNRPLIAFEKRLEKVTGMLQNFGNAANKKFSIKVSLDSRALRSQMEKAVNTKITFKNFGVSETALAETSKIICARLDNTPIRLKNIKIDISDLVAQKRLVRTMMSQLQANIPVSVNFKEANMKLREWKNTTESKYKLHINADISQAKFLANVKKSMAAAKGKIGKMEIDLKDPKLRMNVDQAALRAQIKAAIANHEFTIRTRVSNSASAGGSRGNSREAARHGLIGGAAGAGMGFMRGAIPGLGAAFAFSQLNKINQEMQGQQLAMTAVMGSESAGQEQSKWVKDLSNKIGMDYRKVAPSYNKMLASGQTSGMSTESVQNIFQGISEYGRTMGLDSETMKGSMKAIEQMMNKGQVMSEELKGQLAERMPGAMSAMAEAAGFGTDEKGVAKLMEAMQKGQVKSKAVLEKFSAILAERARQGGALEKAMHSTAAEQARMNNSFSDLVAIFSKAGFDAGMASFFRSMATAMKDAGPGVQALGSAFELLIEPVNAVIQSGGILLNTLPKIGSLFGMTGGEVAALGVAFGLFLSPLGSVVGAIGLLGLAIEDVQGYMDGKDSLFGRWLAGSSEMRSAFEDLSKQAKIFGENITMASKASGELDDGLKGLSFPEFFISTMRELSTFLDAFNTTVNRFVKAGQYAQQMNTSGTTVEANALNMQAMYMGPEWVDKQLTEKYTAESMASIPAQNDVPMRSLNPDEIADIVRNLIDTREAMTLPPIEVTMPITIEGNATADTMNSMSLVPGMVKDAMKDVLRDAMINMKETK